MNKHSEIYNYDDGAEQVLAISYVRMQNSDFENLFNTDEALEKGTVFPELYLPFCRERGVR